MSENRLVYNIFLDYNGNFMGVLFIIMNYVHVKFSCINGLIKSFNFVFITLKDKTNKQKNDKPYKLSVMGK